MENLIKPTVEKDKWKYEEREKENIEDEQKNT